MSTGREAARDLRYGRRGGRWASSATGKTDEILATFARLRNDPSVDWPDRTAAGPSTPSTPEEWNGRARIAQALVDAGSPLTPTDAEALSRVPNPTSAFDLEALFGDAFVAGRGRPLAPGVPPSGDGTRGSVPGPSTPGKPSGLTGQRTPSPIE